MKKYVFLLAACLVLITTNLSALVVFSFSDNDLLPTSSVINAGDAFSFDVQVTSTSEFLLGATYFLNVNPQGSGLFSIANRVTTNSSFPDLQSNNSQVLAPASALLDPQNNDNLGGTVANTNLPLGPGNYFVATLTISSSASLPLGVYTIGFTDTTIATDDGFNDVEPVRGTYTVTVVPEPSTLLLGSLGMCALFLRRRRR